MLVKTLWMYERVLLGLKSEDEEVREYANCCLSYLTCFLRLEIISVPEHVERWMEHLPEAQWH